MRSRLAYEAGVVHDNGNRYVDSTWPTNFKEKRTLLRNELSRQILESPFEAQITFKCLKLDIFCIKKKKHKT